MLRGAIYGLTAAAIWGGMYVVSDVVLKIVPPFTLLSIRLGLGLLVLWLVTLRMSHVRFPAGRHLWTLLAVGFLGFGVSVGAQFVGTDKSSAINGALITSAAPAFILIFAVLLLRESLTTQRLLAVGLATVGVLVIIDPTKADFSSETFFGDLALGAAAVTWGLFSVLVRKVSGSADTMMVTLVGFIGGLALTLPAAALELRDTNIGIIDGGVLLGILYLGIISTAVAMWLWNRAFALVDAATASLFFFAQPLVGAVLSTLLLQQAITDQLLIGGLLIGLGVLLAISPVERLNNAKAPT